MNAKTVMITGATHGIGYATATGLAAQGYNLVLLCRNPNAAAELKGQLLQQYSAQFPAMDIEVLVADLSDMASVKAAAELYIASGKPLHILINNAGMVNMQREIVTIAGEEIEKMFVVNHLGHYLLTELLMPLLIKTADQCSEPSRLVVVASDAHALFCKGINWADLDRSQSFKTFKVYGESKLANILMVKALAANVDAAKVQVNSLHPGAVKSNLGVDNNNYWFTPIVKFLTGLFFISPEDGAKTTLFLATQPINTQGEYYYKCKPYKAKPWALDLEAAEVLVQKSRDILKQYLANA